MKLVIPPNLNLFNMKAKAPHVLHTDGLQKLTLDGLIDTGALQVQSLNKTSIKSSCWQTKSLTKPVLCQTFKLWWPTDN